MKKTIVLLGLCLAAGVPVLVLSAMVSALLGPFNADAIPATPNAASAGGRPIPPAVLGLYVQAAATCPGLDWTILAAIGAVESGNGTSNLPGVHSGHNDAGAEGPMQFEPATFAEYSEPVPPGGADPPSPYDPVDAVYAAARMLCANGAGDPSHVADAVAAYNHSDSYVQTVLQLATSLDAPSETAQAGMVAAGFALAQVGTPYRFGSETQGYGFDCSGLAQAAWRAAGVSLPRVAQAQFDSRPTLPADSVLEPGDLVFFGSSPLSVTHVGIVVGDGIMVDAPHTGSVVRLEHFPALRGAPWGEDEFVGALRPGL